MRRRRSWYCRNDDSLEYRGLDVLALDIHHGKSYVSTGFANIEADRLRETFEIAKLVCAVRPWLHVNGPNLDKPARRRPGNHLDLAFAIARRVALPCLGEAGRPASGDEQ